MISLAWLYSFGIWFGIDDNCSEIGSVYVLSGSLIQCDNYVNIHCDKWSQDVTMTYVKCYFLGPFSQSLATPSYL